MEKVPGTRESRGKKRLLPCARLTEDDALNDSASLQLQVILPLQCAWLAAASNGRQATVCMRMRHSGERGQHGQHERRDEVVQFHHCEAACRVFASFVNVMVKFIVCVDVNVNGGQDA